MVKYSQIERWRYSFSVHPGFVVDIQVFFISIFFTIWPFKAHFDEKRMSLSTGLMGHLDGYNAIVTR